MKEPQVVSRHQYRWGPKLLSGAIFLGPFVWLLLFFLDEQTLPAVIWLGAGLVIAPFMLPLLLTYTIFVLTVGKDKIEITYLTKTRSILINDIVDVRTRGMNVLESVYVRDRSGNKVSFEKGVEDYDKLKRFLFTTASTNTVQYDEEKALSTHRYGKWYRGTLVFALIAIWTILGVVFPWRIWTRGVTAADLDSLGLSALLIVAGVLWAFTVASEVPFVMKVDREGIRAQWLRKRRKILFGETTRVKVTHLSPDRDDFHNRQQWQ